ncbi:hypothetical protein ACHQM5_013388 [Ranunculus cassubicifolius]
MASSPHHSPNIVILPYMAQGHTLPLLDLSKALSQRGLNVTIITTPWNAPAISKHIQTHPNIYIKQIPFPQTQDIPNGCENTSQLPSMLYLAPFLEAAAQLQQPFEELLQDMANTGSLPICVISDYFLSWSAVGCRKWNIPRLVFLGNGVLSMAITKSLFRNWSDLVIGSGADPIHFPGVKLPFSLTLNDMPRLKQYTDPTDRFTKFMIQIEEWDKESSGVIVNSFMEIESDHVSSLESFYKDGSKAWCIGPFLLHETHKMKNPSEPYIKWLDDQKKCKSVIYVSFGSQADMSDTQLDELAYGLEMSGHPFIWAVKSETWTPPKEVELRIMGRGWIIQNWVDQRSILAHPATGGFLSHCGWNSMMESLCAGVPILAWPLTSDQPLNAKFLVDSLGAALWITQNLSETGSVGREIVCEATKEFMESESGERVRGKVQVLAELARKAMHNGGSSDKNLAELIEYLCMHKEKQHTLK